MPANVAASWLVTLALLGWLADVRLAQFTPLTDRREGIILEGHWDSCRENDGEYAERIYDGRSPAIGPFELHLGPEHDFALFRGQQDAHRDHADSANLLRPHTVAVVNGFGKHIWAAASLRLEAVLAGGSREDCESWWVTLASIQ